MTEIRTYPEYGTVDIVYSPDDDGWYAQSHQDMNLATALYPTHTLLIVALVKGKAIFNL